MDFVFFYLFSLLWVAKTPASRYTHIMAFTDPPLIALSGHVAQRLKGWKFIYNVQDLYPDTALALGAMSEGLLYRLCSQLNTRLLRRADAVVAIGEKMAARIRRQVSSTTRVEVIPNWADAEKIKPTGESHTELRRELHLNDAFTLIYAGNMGLAQEIDVLIEVVEAFVGSTEIQFVFMGGGVRRANLERAARDFPNVHFVEYQSKDSLSSYLDLAEMGIVTLAPAMEGLAIPTRTYAYLAAGLPLLTIAHQNSELKKFADLGLGAHFAPDAAEEIVSFLKEQIRRGRKDRREEIRTYFAAHFERRLQTGRYWDLLEEV
jgi:glycosyltransferase involved in cell wall biosynthesis